VAHVGIPVEGGTDIALDGIKKKLDVLYSDAFASLADKGFSQKKLETGYAQAKAHIDKGYLEPDVMKYFPNLAVSEKETPKLKTFIDYLSGISVKVIAPGTPPDPSKQAEAAKPKNGKQPKLTGRAASEAAIRDDVRIITTQPAATAKPKDDFELPDVFATGVDMSDLESVPDHMLPKSRGKAAAAASSGLVTQVVDGNKESLQRPANALTGEQQEALRERAANKEAKKATDEHDPWKEAVADATRAVDSGDDLKFADLPDEAPAAKEPQPAIDESEKTTFDLTPITLQQPNAAKNGVALMTDEQKPGSSLTRLESGSDIDSMFSTPTRSQQKRDDGFNAVFSEVLVSSLNTKMVDRIDGLIRTEAVSTLVKLGLDGSYEADDTNLKRGMKQFSLTMKGNPQTEIFFATAFFKSLEAVGLTPTRVVRANNAIRMDFTRYVTVPKGYEKMSPVSRERAVDRAIENLMNEIEDQFTRACANIKVQNGVTNFLPKYYAALNDTAQKIHSHDMAKYGESPPAYAILTPVIAGMQGDDVLLGFDSRYKGFITHSEEPIAKAIKDKSVTGVTLGNGVVQIRATKVKGNAAIIEGLKAVTKRKITEKAVAETNNVTARRQDNEAMPSDIAAVVKELSHVRHDSAAIADKIDELSERLALNSSFRLNLPPDAQRQMEQLLVTRGVIRDGLEEMPLKDSKARPVQVAVPAQETVPALTHDRSKEAVADIDFQENAPTQMSQEDVEKATAPKRPERVSGWQGAMTKVGLALALGGGVVETGHRTGIIGNEKPNAPRYSIPERKVKKVVVPKKNSAQDDIRAEGAKNPLDRGNDNSTGPSVGN